MFLVDPLRTGAIVPENIKQQLLESFSGYPICLYCKGDLHKIEKPNIEQLVEEKLPKFLDAEKIVLTNGAREGAFLIFFSLYKYLLKEKQEACPCCHS